MSQDVQNLQQMLNNLQQQISLVSSMAGNIANKPSAPIAPALDTLTQHVAPPAQTTPVATQPTQVQKMPTKEDIDAYVRNLVQAEMRNVSQAAPRDITPEPVKEQAPALAAPTPTPKPVVAEPAATTAPIQLSSSEVPKVSTPGMFWESIRPVMASVFTKEQQLWLSQPQNLVGLPGFLRTPEGRDLLTKLLQDYQKFMGA